MNRCLGLSCEKKEKEVENITIRVISPALHQLVKLTLFLVEPLSIYQGYIQAILLQVGKFLCKLDVDCYPMAPKPLQK